MVARTSLLEVYALSTTHSAAATALGATGSGGNRTGGGTRLIRIGEYKMFGNVESIKTCRFAGRSVDSLLVAFSEARVSVLDWDAARHEIVTTSLHYFEDKKEAKAKLPNTPSIPLVRVDPQNRCAVLHCFESTLVVLPFGKAHFSATSANGADDTGMAIDSKSAKDEKRSKPVAAAATADDTKLSGGKSKSSAILTPFMLDIESLITSNSSGGSASIGTIKDLVFLDGYYEPSILILHERKHTHEGRFAVARDTVGLLSISLNLNQQTHSVISIASKLTHYCERLYPVPNTGGALIFAANNIFHWNNQTIDYGLSLNEHGDKSVTVQRMDKSPLVAMFDLAEAAFISPTALVVTSRMGAIYTLTIIPQG